MTDQIDKFFKKEQAIWHRIVSIVGKDPAYVWSEIDKKDFEKLREATIELFRNFHWKKPNLHQYEKEELQKLFLELVGKFWEENKGLLQKGKEEEKKAAEHYGPQNWFEKVKKDLVEINHLIIKARSNQSYEADSKTYDATFDCLFLNSFEYTFTHLLKKLKNFYKDKTILDYGCGTGTHTFEVAEYGKTVYGFDLSKDLIMQAKQKKEPHSNKVRFAVADGIEVPFRDQSFDFVMSLDLVFSHISAKYNDAFKEISRVMKPGGYFLFDCENKWKFMLKREMDVYEAAMKSEKDVGNLYEWGLAEDEWEEKYKGKVKPMILKKFTYKEIKQIMEENGFKIVKNWAGASMTTSFIPAIFSKGDELYEERIGLSKTRFGRLQLWASARVDYLIGKLPYCSKKGYTHIILAKKIR